MPLFKKKKVKVADVTPKKKTVKTRVSNVKKKIISAFKKPSRSLPVPRKRFVTIQKHEGNPIIEPRPDHFWEMKATFNPAALHTDGRVHLLYRAIGGDDMSTLGYAVSDDGIMIAERPDKFAFKHESKGATPLTSVPKINYLSGGGSAGGAEDPRLMLMEEEDKIYLTYTAFDGWGSVRIALATISKEDFVNQQWRWSSPVFLSPKGEIHKNWVLFPEKINGKYAILHSISPRISIEYVDDLADFENDERSIKSHYDKRSNSLEWDNWVRGAGPPPIRTRIGWLLFYHAMDIRDPNRYKLGAMILDVKDPTRILYRSRMPVLEPEEWYENSGWKSGVVYSCGAVVKNGDLYVYYGGADSVVCVAMANLDYFLEELVQCGTPRLTKKSNVKVKNA